MNSIKDLKSDTENANKGTQRGLKLLDDSLRKYGAGRSILIDKHGKIIAGNKTVERAADIGLDDLLIVETDGTKLVAVKRNDLDLEIDSAARELAYADNRVGQLDLDWDAEQILADLEAGVDLEGLFSDIELEDFGWEADVVDVEEQARRTLAERFIVPPFSVLDARQGYWQERKRAWIDLGIESELGRGEAMPPGGSLRPATSLNAEGKTVRGDGAGRPIAERERERVIRMAMHNDPMQRKQKYDAIMPDALGKI